MVDSIVVILSRINDSSTIHPRRHNQTMINIKKILVSIIVVAVAFVV